MRTALHARGMGTALHAEWTKLRTAPGTWWLLLGAVAATAGLSALAAAAVRCGTDCEADLTKVSLTGVQLGQAVVAILAALVIGNEYSTGMVRVSLAAVPRRTRMLAAKAVVVVAVTGAAAAAGVAGSLLAGRLLLPDHAFTWRPAVGSVAYLVLVGLLSLGLATAARSPAAAVGIVLGLLYAWPIVARVVTDPAWSRRLQQAGPMNAGTAVQATRDLASLPISPWAGLGVLGLWALGAMLAGWLLLVRRDA
ncbi:ABC transporter permease [Dactylosporangium sp. CA-139066]|uniref:ABC transporter permease n=1 Tax=Dactylosporangium sp. CA-139066 TaxID=3239930 RepID=UPI003D8DABB5